MGLEVLFWIWVLTWMTKTAATDVLHAVKGTPNPRYELKRERALKAGQPVKGPTRYGSREWAADLLSDALVANTEKRRKSAKAKAQPVDDMIGIVREPVARQPRPQSDWPAVYDPNNALNCPDCKGEVVVDGRPCPRCLAEQQRRNAEWEKRHETAKPQPKPEPTPDTRPDATIIRFPNPNNIEREITMANSEVTGLSTAIAYARDVASAHQSFSSAGAEGYVGSLEQGGNGPEVISSAREAMEASGVATAKWAAHREVLEKQLNVREAYQGNPDAGNKQFVVNE